MIKQKLDFEMLSRREILKMTASVVGITSGLGSQNALAASDPKIVEAAKKEGAISLYSSASTCLLYTSPSPRDS